MIRRPVVVGYGMVAYVAFLTVFAYTIGFLADTGVPKGIDDGSSGPAWVAVLVNGTLLSLFAVQHSVMARPSFKVRWTRLVPRSIERSSFVLAASLVLALLLWQWRPLTASVWSVDHGVSRAALWGLYGLGWVIVVGSTFLINHFDLFGLRQVVAQARDRPLVPLGFRQPIAYRFVRHPIMVGFLVAFWAAPDMSVGRLLFAALASGYILVGVRFEERDLRAELGELYRRYEDEVPRFVPRRRSRAERGGSVAPVGLDDRRPVAQDHN